MLSLIRALTSVDLYTLERIRKYAALPPQDDSDMEDLQAPGSANYQGFCATESDIRTMVPRRFTNKSHEHKA
jgi:hypothetical protein